MAGIILATSYNFTIPEIGADLREFGTITATGGVGTLRYTISGRDDPDLFELHNGGTLRLKAGAVLDYEDPSIANRYTLTVSVTDGASTEQTQVIIDVENVDEKPEFTSANYFFRLNEHELKAGASIIHNIASAISNSDDGHLRYEIIYPYADHESFEDNGFFKVRGGLGHRAELYAAKDVDFETSTSHDPNSNSAPGAILFRFKIRASRVSDSTLYDEKDVFVAVSDVDDEAPVITAYDSRWKLAPGQTPMGRIAENAQGADSGISFAISDADTAISISVTDNVTTDIDPNSFSITGTEADKFTVAPPRYPNGFWRLKLKPGEDLDYEAHDRLTLYVTVSDGVQESEPMEVRIVVENVVEPPQFDVVPSRTAFTERGGPVRVEENAAGAEIELVFRYVEKDTNYQPLTFRFTNIQTGNDESHRFDFIPAGTDELGTPLWKLKLKDGVFLDHESEPTIDLRITANNGIADSDSTEVTLEVVDVADEELPFFVPENVANQYVVGTFNPYGASDTAHYEITAGNDDDIFAIDRFSGVISVVDAGGLDYEDTPSYSLTISETIPGDPTITRTATAIINLENVNDEVPDIFWVDSAGQLLRSTALAENQHGVDTGLFLQVSDDDTSAIEDFTFTMTSADITDPEDVFDIIHISTDAAGVHMYKLKLHDGVALDYEAAAQLRLTITVNDGDNDSDSTTATINVGDVNDVAPHITASRGAIGGVVSENVAGAETGITLTVADADTPQSDLKFSLHDNGDGGIADKLELVRRGAEWVLKLKTGAMFDAESDVGTLSTLGIHSEITVTVSDGVHSHEEDLPLFINDENDNLPKLHAINDIKTASIAESVAALNTGIAFAISDADVSQSINIQHQFMLHISGDQADKFTIKKMTYQHDIGTDDAYDVSGGNFWRLKLKANADLAYDSTDASANELKLQVHARDTKYSSNSIEVTINIIEVDDGLAFTQNIYRAYVEESENSGEVITVEAISDATISDLRYSITSGDAGLFSIDAESGVISLSGALDAESVQDYNLNVQAVDGTKTATAEVVVRVVDINEHAVVFGADAVVYASDFADGDVSEATSVGRVLATATASDADVNARLTYSISAGNDDNIFTIDAATGAVRLARALDYATASAHRIEITASDGRFDGRHDATTNIDFSITEADNQFPLLISIAKNGAITENILGADSGISFLVADLESAATPDFIISGGQADKFELSATTAQSGSVIWALKLKSGVYLDYEEDARIELSITGDNGLQRTNSIDVSIDVVDSEPEIYTVNVAESAEIGDALAVLSVFDVGTSGITYNIASGNDAGVFRLDGNILRLASALDYEDGALAKNYTILVNIADGTTARTATLNINIMDENDNAPMLTEAVADMRGAVAENVVGADTGIAFVRADADSAGVNDFEFSITSADSLDQSGLFHLVEDAGLWRLQLMAESALDYEVASVIALDVKVNDGVADSDSIRVYVDVGDVNDVAPTLTPIERAGAVDENDAGAETGVQFSVADADSAVGDFTFSITDDDGLDQSALFGMAHVSTDADGVSFWQLALQDNIALNYEAAAAVGLNVKVSDGDADSDSFYVSITVHDVDEPIGLVGDLAGDVRESANPATPTSTTGTISGYTDPENILPALATAEAIIVKDADSGGVLSKTGHYGTFSFTPAAAGAMEFGAWRYVLDGNNLAVRALNDGDSLSESFTLTYTLTSGGVSITRDESITLTILGRDSDIYFVDAQGDKIVDAQGDEVSVLGDAVHEFNIERGRDALNGGVVLGALMPKIGGVVDADNIEIALADTVPVDVAQHFSINAGGDLVFTGSKDDVAKFAAQFRVDLVARAPDETTEELAFHVAINLINEVDDGQARIGIRGNDGALVNAESDLAQLDVGWLLTGAVTQADPDGVVGAPSWRWFHVSDPDTTIGMGAEYQIEESDRRKIIGVEHSYNDGSRADDFVFTTTLEVAVPRLIMSVPDSEKDQDHTLVIPDGNNGAVLQGGNGADTITAGDGDDLIDGGLGDDVIDLEKDSQDQDEVMYRIGNRYNRDGGDGITNFNRGQDTLIFSIDRSDAEANGFTLRDGADIDDFIVYLQNNTPDDLVDDQFLVLLNFDFAGLTGLSFHFQDSVFFTGGRIAMPIMQVDFAETVERQEIIDMIADAGASPADVLYRHSILKDLNYLDDFLGGADSLGFSVSDVL